MLNYETLLSFVYFLIFLDIQNCIFVVFIVVILMLCHLMCHVISHVIINFLIYFLFIFFVDNIKYINRLYTFILGSFNFNYI